jgi:hypothetical protein
MITFKWFSISRSADYLPVLLLASWPFVSFLSANLQESEYFQRIVYIWIGYLAICFLAVGILKLLFRKLPTARASLLVGVMAAWFLSYLPMANTLAEWGIGYGRPHLLIWLAITVLLALITLWIRPLRDVTFITTAISVGLLAFPAYQIGDSYFATAMAATENQPVTKPDQNTSSASGVAKQRPNVYWILLDGYSRADLLKEQTGFDNQPFLKQLEVEGFRIGTKSTSNYSSTKFSVSTTMSMDYYLPVGKRLNHAMWTDRLSGSNEVTRRFKSHGYTNIHVEPGSNNLKTRCGGYEDICITGQQSSKAFLTESDVGLLKLSPLFRIFRRLDLGILGITLIDPKEMFAKLRKVGSRPFFVFGHILSPHTPNRFKKNCSRQDQIKWNVLDRYLNSDVVEGYITDVGCLNKEVIAGVKRILAEDPTDPIIIVQSDHGSPLLESNSFENNLIRFANLSAIRFPNNCGQQYYPSISSVNTFRMVFSCIEDTPLPLLPDRHFLIYEGDDGFTEVNLKWR